MKLALLSDIHANLPALDACLETIAAQGVDRMAFLGDFVGYGPDPEAVVQRVRPMIEKGAIAVVGNHDSLAAGKGGISGLGRIGKLARQPCLQPLCD